MINQLIKDKNISLIPGSPYVPAYPGQPYLPARTATEMRKVCGYETTTVTPPGTHMGFVRRDDAVGYESPWFYTLLDDVTNLPVSGYVKTDRTYVCRNEPVLVHYPAQPYIPPRPAITAVPPRVDVSFNLGWNAGARSIRSFDHIGRIEFKVSPSAIGVVAGLSDTDPDAGYQSITFGWYFSHGIARIIEGGTTKAYIGQHIASDVFAVERFFDEVRYLKNGVEAYQSANTSVGTLFMDVSMYSGGDSLYDPLFAGCGESLQSMSPVLGTARGSARVTASGGHSYMEPLTGAGGISDVVVGEGAYAHFEPMTSRALGAQYTRVGISHASMLPLTSSIRRAVRVASTLKPLVGLSSDKVYGSASGQFQPLTSSITSGLLKPSYAIGFGAMTYLTGGAAGLTGTVGGSGAEMAAMDGLSSGDDNVDTLKSYGQSVVSMPPMLGYASAYEGNHKATMVSVVGGFSELSAPVERFVVMTTDMSMVTFISVGKLADAQLMSSLTTLTDMEYAATLNAVMRSLVMMSFGVPVFDDVNQAWVVNANTGASSRYEDFAFNSYGKIGKSYYGCKSNGLHLLEGETDNTLPIRASVDFGNSNFGTSLLKSCTNAYLGLSAGGKLFLKVTVEGKEYIYAARDGSEQMQTQRVDLGRGLRANYLHFELYNNDGCDFELDSVEFSVVPLSRRI